MKLKLIRDPSRSTDKSTEGRLYIDDTQVCFTLEDRDRHLETAGCGAKVYGETCIPRGIYPVIIDYSNHYKKDMPHVLNVSCFDGVRIHVGNRPEDTEGCILLGLKAGTNFIEHSAEAFSVFFNDLQHGLAEGPVTLEIL